MDSFKKFDDIIITELAAVEMLSKLAEYEIFNKKVPDHELLSIKSSFKSFLKDEEKLLMSLSDEEKEMLNKYLIYRARLFKKSSQNSPLFLSIPKILELKGNSLIQEKNEYIAMLLGTEQRDIFLSFIDELLTLKNTSSLKKPLIRSNIVNTKYACILSSNYFFQRRLIDRDFYTPYNLYLDYQGLANLDGMSSRDYTDIRNIISIKELFKMTSNKNNKIGNESNITDLLLIRTALCMMNQDTFNELMSDDIFRNMITKRLSSVYENPNELLNKDRERHRIISIKM